MKEVKIITLLTDFGLQDGYVGVMKGVIWGIAPRAQIADLTHHVSPQNVLEGALTLGRCVPFFPMGSVHVGVVDPGVGTQRRSIAARLGSQFFVGPDNGLFTVLVEQARGANEPIEVVHLNRPAFWLPQVSKSFHGRDIFAPVGAALVNGVPLTELGDPIHDFILLEIPRPQPYRGGWKGIIQHIDTFGNLRTNIEARHLSALGEVEIHLKNAAIREVVQTFGERAAGELVAMIESSGNLEVALVNGSAARALEASVGDEVVVIPQPSRTIK